MGHDIKPIGKHKLLVSDTKALAIDLSNRFKINIEYGYQDLYPYQSLIDGPFVISAETITLGRISCPESDECLFLFDEFHQQRELVKEYGNELFSLPYFKTERDIEYFNSTVENFSYAFRNDKEDLCWGTIYNDTFRCDKYYFSSWWNLCRQFTKEQEYIGYDSLNQFRRQLKEFYAKIGGDMIVFCDDQGKDQDLGYADYDWSTLLSEINRRFGTKTLHISDFMKTLDYPDDFPPAFIDDFADLHDE